MEKIPLIWPKKFKEAYCARYRCPEEDFKRHLFWKALYRHALPFALVLYAVRPAFFKEDFYLLGEIGEMTQADIFKHELNAYRGRNLREKSWGRQVFGIRVSAKRLIRIKNKIYASG